MHMCIFYIHNRYLTLPTLLYSNIYNTSKNEVNEL